MDFILLSMLPIRTKAVILLGRKQFNKGANMWERRSQRSRLGGKSNKRQRRKRRTRAKRDKWSLDTVAGDSTS